MIPFVPVKQELEILHIFEDKKAGRFVVACKITVIFLIGDKKYKHANLHMLPVGELNDKNADPSFPGPSDPAEGGTKPPSEPPI